MFCRNCGSNINDQATTCPNCGAPAVPSQPIQMQQPQHAVPHQYTASTQYVSPPRKKRRGCLVAILVVLALIAAVVAAAYFLFPGLIRPVNLGVKSSRKAYESAMVKMSYTKDEAPGEGQQVDYVYEYGPLAPVSIQLSSEEVSSFMNYNRPAYFPLKNVQVKIGDDSSEFSGTLDRDYAINYLLRGNYSHDEIEEMLRSIGADKLLPARINLYIQMDGSIADNQVDRLQLDSASVMGFSIPSEYVSSDEAYSAVRSAINLLLQDYYKNSGTYFESIRVIDGEIVIDGQVPSSLTRTPKD